jgi:hypothetical protein
MSRALHATSHNPRISSFAWRWTIAISLFVIPTAISAQTSQGGSLADIARQVRAQKQGQASAGSNAQQVADELSDDQNHSDDAPGGFKTYNAGDYTLWVPAPYKVSGHDDAGVMLEGPSVGSKRPLLLVGTPLLLPPGASDQVFRDSATKFSHLYARNATCAKSAAGNRTAYKCSLAVADLNWLRVSGTGWFLRSANTVYPVLCAVPSESNNRDYINNPRAASKDNASEAPDPAEQDVSAVRQKCETVFQSIRPKEDKPQPATVQLRAPVATGSGPVVQSQQNAAQAEVGPSSLNTPASAVPAGYKIHRFQYCSGPQQCWDGSTFVPVEAQLVSSNCKQYVFESKVQGTTFLLMAGPAAGQCDGQGAGAADLVRWKQLADPENKRAPGTYNTVSTQTTKLNGKLATITTMHFRNGLTDWMGKRAEIESNGVPLVVGCLAPRDHFDDGYAICSTLIDALQLP